MQGMAHHQHDRYLHAGWRQHQDHDHHIVQDGGRVHGSEKVGHLLNSPIETEQLRLLRFATTGGKQPKATLRMALHPHLARIGQAAGVCNNSIDTKTGDDTG